MTQTYHTRSGLTISDRLLRVMRELAALPPNEWMPLTHVHGLTLRALVQRDFADVSHLSSPPLYKLSSRGRLVLPAFETVARRDDGICPRCSERPLHFTKSGRSSGYCRECGNARPQRKRKPGLCKCGQPRHVSAKGYVYRRCADCEAAYKRQFKRDKRAKLLARAKAGEVILCRVCKTNPVHRTDNSISELCRDCYNAYRQQLRHRQRYTRWNKGA